MFERVFRPFARSTVFFRNINRAAILFLIIEFFDELNYGAQGAVLPALRLDLALDYGQIGSLLGLSGLIGGLIEPLILLMGDTRWRKTLMLGGGLVIAASLIWISTAQSYLPVLLALSLAYPASGAFVSLAQASLMDQNHGRQSQMMARWTAAGSLGNLVGPLILAAGFAAGLGWRWSYLALGLFGLLLVFGVWRTRIAPPGDAQDGQHAPSWNPRILLDNARLAVRSRLLVHWLVLLELADLLMDIYSTYIVLYFADVIGLSASMTALALAGLMVVGLATDLLAIPLLERIPGRKIVRFSAAAACIVYPALLLAPWPEVKIILALGVGFTTMGWYPVLQGEAYAALPERSATVNALGSVVSALGKGLTWLVGWTALQTGLPAAMWLLLAGPLALLLFLPRRTDLNNEEPPEFSLK